MTKGNQASHATNGRGDQRDLQILEQAEEYSHTDPLNQRGNRHNTYDDETYQRSNLPDRGETPLQDRGNPSTFGQTNGGALSTRCRPIWPNCEKIHVKAGGAVSERARQSSVSTFSFACEAKPNYDGPRSQDHYQRGAISPQLSAYLQHTRLSRGCLNM